MQDTFDWESVTSRARQTTCETRQWGLLWVRTPERCAWGVWSGSGFFRRAAGLGGLVSRWPAGPGLEACVNGVERSEMEKKTALKIFSLLMLRAFPTAGFEREVQFRGASDISDFGGLGRFLRSHTAGGSLRKCPVSHVSFSSRPTRTRALHSQRSISPRRPIMQNGRLLANS